MGTQITSDSNANSKQQLVITDVAFGAIVVGFNDLVIWIGADAIAAGNHVEIVETLKQVRNAMIESEIPSLHAVVGAGRARILAGAPTAETQVAIEHGQGYADRSQSLFFTNGVNLAIDRLLESVLKAS